MVSGFLCASLQIYKEAKDLDFYVKNRDGNVFEGWCWCGKLALD